MSSKDDMRAYYRERAPVYERVYNYSQRQKDLRYLEQYIPKQFAGRDVLEIAAGTGYWTRFIAGQANSVLATDVTEEALQQIDSTKASISTQILDAYDLDQLQTKYSGFFAGLWLSHVPKEQLTSFISQIHYRILSGAIVMFIDNSIAQCKSLPITSTDDAGNTYQTRTLDNGTEYEVLKNFPGEQELLAVTDVYGLNHNFIELDHFWLFQYTAI